LYAYPVVDILCIILLAFTVARLTRVVVDDSITIGFRQWVVRRFGEDSGWSTLVHCIWCTGWWVSLICTLIVFPFLSLPWFVLPLLAVAIAQIAPMILQVSDALVRRAE
jgi:hypothetical protein